MTGATTLKAEPLLSLFEKVGHTLGTGGPSHWLRSMH